MSLAEITLNGETILVEVAVVGANVSANISASDATGRCEYTAASPGDLGRRVEGLLGALTGTLQRALAGAAADEWSVCQRRLQGRQRRGVPRQR